MHTAHLMVATFWQALLRALGDRSHDWNGFVTASCYALGSAAVLALAGARALADPSRRLRIIQASLLTSAVLVAAMGAAEAAWPLCVAYVLFQVVWQLSGTVYILQVGAEVREAAAATPEARPRLALLLSTTGLVSSCVQSAAQSAFKSLGRRGGGPSLPLPTRFELLGADVI